MKKLAQGFITAAQDSNLGSLSRESGALPLSHCALSESMGLHRVTLAKKQCRLDIRTFSFILIVCNWIYGVTWSYIRKAAV